ncbi:hypothetical protein [Photobacterium leiognathi]|uniref:hypothetical protein n=1 Tax=Photobacterium leiognathi TaxID=553611 RepID=UPI00273A4EC8|nr:hypothetical protein [Photobacterium leiognathi]
MNTNTPLSLAPYLSEQQISLPAPRQGAIAARHIELSLNAVPAYLRELQQNQLVALQDIDPELADELERGIATAEAAIEHAIKGLRTINSFLNNN